MKKTNWIRACAGAMILTGTCSFAVQNAQAAVVFSDNFTRVGGDSSDLGTPSGLNAPWSESITPFVVVPVDNRPDVAISNGQLHVIPNSPPGLFGVSYSTSDFAGEFGTTLKSNNGKVVWTFNMQSSRPDLVGTMAPPFNAFTPFTSVVLASTGTTPGDSYGYAVAWGNPAHERIRLLKFRPEGTGSHSTAIISTEAIEPFNAMDTSYLSVRVEYEPSSDEWSLYLRDDGDTSFQLPSSGLLTEIGAGVKDDTYTSNYTIGYVGFSGLLAPGAPNAYAYAYDNFTISVVPEPSAFLLASVGLVGIAAARRKLRKQGA